MKPRTKKLSLCASTLVLALALPLLLSSCGNEADALTDAGGNDVARTLNVHIGPKQGFISATAGIPGTRSTVDESTKAVEWEEGDRIFLTVEFDITQGNYSKGYTLVRTASATWNLYEKFIGTHNSQGDPTDLTALTPLSGIPVALAATSLVKATAFYLDCKTWAEGNNVTCLSGGGTRDVMQDVLQNLPPFADLNFNMKHYNSTRLSFPVGLTPGKQYYVDGFNAVNSCQKDMGTVTYTPAVKVPFAADDDGSLTLCADIAGTDQTVTLKEMDTDVAVYSATFTAAHGSSYRCIIPTSGGIDPDTHPELLPIDPIVPGNAVYAVNGYWVTAPGAEDATYQWASSITATVMDNDPCTGNGGWRMPTMEDFEKMAGLTLTWPWSQGVSTAYKDVLSDFTAWHAAFPHGVNDYWSSVIKSESSYNSVWYMGTSSDYTIYYAKTMSPSRYRIRCVQPQ